MCRPSRPGIAGLLLVPVAYAWLTPPARDVTPLRGSAFALLAWLDLQAFGRLEMFPRLLVAAQCLKGQGQVVVGVGGVRIQFKVRW